MQTTLTGKIWIYSKSPFENSYQNVIKFASAEEMDNFFGTDNDLLTEIYYSDTYQQIPTSGNIIVEGRVDKYQSSSYMRFQNYGRIYYAFILDCIYQNENATELIFEIDVWNTYQQELFQTKFGGYVEQGHLPLENNGMLNITPSKQGFNVGEKQIVDVINLTGVDNTTLDIGIVDWCVFVLKPTAQISSTDPYVDLNGNPSSFKSFRYFVLPINITEGYCYSFKYQGVTYAKRSMDMVIKIMTNSYTEGSINTVNQCVNVFITKHCGLDYTFNGSIVDIKDTNLSGYIHGTSAVTTNTSGNVSTGSQDSYVNWTTDITRAGHTFSADMVVRLVALCRNYQILPSVILAQCYYESFFGDSNVAIINNNWSGMSTSYFEGEKTRSSGVVVTLGSARPTSEGGYYYKYSSANDWLADYMYLLRPRPDGNGNFYNISGQTTVYNAFKGLFIAGGSDVNYATTPWETYVDTGVNIYNGICTENGQSVIDSLDALVYTAGNWVSTDPIKNNKGLEYLSTLLGQKLGNGECYAVPSAYAYFLSGIAIGAGIAYGEPVLPNGNPSSAYAIGFTYDWAKYGWTVVEEPDFSDLRIGDIICWKAYSSKTSGQHGHTDVIRGIDTNTNYLLTYSQNISKKRYLIEHTTSWDSSACQCIIHPPESVTGIYTTGNNTGSTITTSASGDAILEIISMTLTTPKTIDVGENLIKKIRYYLDSAITQFSSSKDFESQLITSEFCEIKLYDGYGNGYVFAPELLPLDESINNTVTLYGAVSDSNHNQIAIDNYNASIINSNSSTQLANNINFGLCDSTSKSLTILTDATANYFQANKNQYDAQQTSFNENRELLQKQFALSDKQVALANEQATYNANYALQTSELKIYQDIGSDALNLASNIANVNLFGSLSSAYSGANNYINNTRANENQQQQVQFTEDNNSMRSESNALSNMQAKLALNQSVRAYNASIKDITNQPTSIQQLGSDLSFQCGNNLNNIFISISIPRKLSLTQANEYLKAYGVIQNTYYSDIRDITEYRQIWNYIKCNTVDITSLNINASHLNALKSVFISGVRIWNYGQFLNSYYLNLHDLENTDGLVT